VVDGVSYENVGVRLKSYVGSARTLDQKCAWKIDLNRYDSNGEYAGVETLTINNMVQDQSYIHERLAYMLYQAVGVPAPRVGYARVSMNGTDYGLYALVENIDENMLSRWFGDGTGTLYEGAYGVDLYTGYENSFDFKQGDDPTNRSDLTTVIDILQRSPTDANLAELEQHVDMDNILLNRAVESAILHWDGYTTANNYRLYHDPISDRFYMLPWGADQTFVDYWYGPWSGWGQLWTWCVQNPSCSERYDQKLMEVTDIMMGLNLPDEAERLALFLYDDIQSDPRREFSVSYWQYRYDATIATLNDYPTSLQAQVLAH
jgi:spore coat protein CotH